MLRRSPHPGVAAIVARIPRAEAGREMTDAFASEITAFERLSESSRDDVVTGVERNLGRWWRWLSSGEAPAEGDFDPLREWARDRATEGVRLEDLLRAFALGGQVGWGLIRRHARPDEGEALLDAAELLMRYVDWISAVVADTYLAERDVLVSEEERRTRALLDRLSTGAALDPADLELAERLGVPVGPAYAPFAVVMPGRPPGRHAALAARLRQGGRSLAVTEGDRVVGLAWRPVDLADLDEGPDIVLAIAAPTPRDQLADARDELVLLAEHGRRIGLRGRLQAEDNLVEILMLRSPRVAARLREVALASLNDPAHAELRRTLEILLSHRFDRAAASGALHIHRNTLAYRVRRIEEVTGLDLGSPRDLAVVYLAIGVGADEPEPV
jgi:PucR C-terminal helix-turn-helix domain